MDEPSSLTHPNLFISIIDLFPALPDSSHAPPTRHAVK
jgi:hypothetical protein